MIWIGILIGIIIGAALMFAVSYVIGNATEKGRQRKMEDEFYLKHYLDNTNNE